jgi:hypothetical protein
LGLLITEEDPSNLVGKNRIHVHFIPALYLKGLAGSMCVYKEFGAKFRY